jgi:hypothetical protein
MAKRNLTKTATTPPIAQLVDVMFGKAHHLFFVAATLDLVDLIKDGAKTIECLAKQRRSCLTVSRPACPAQNGRFGRN